MAYDLLSSAAPTEVFKALGYPIRWSIVTQMAAVDDEGRPSGVVGGHGQQPAAGRAPAAETRCAEHCMPVTAPTSRLPSHGDAG